MERAALLVVVMKLGEFDEIRPKVFKEGKTTLPSCLEDKSHTKIQESILRGPSVEHDFALVTRDTYASKYRKNKQKAPRKRRGQELRTRTGCLTCRKSHIKCDEVKQICGRCTKLHRTCVYEESNTER